MAMSVTNVQGFEGARPQLETCLVAPPAMPPPNQAGLAYPQHKAEQNLAGLAEQ